MTDHDIRMNRYVIELRRAKVRQGIRSLRHYREINHRLGVLEAAMYVRGALAEYRQTMKVLAR